MTNLEKFRAALLSEMSGKPPQVFDPSRVREITALQFVFHTSLVTVWQVGDELIMVDNDDDGWQLFESVDELLARFRTE